MRDACILAAAVVLGGAAAPIDVVPGFDVQVMVMLATSAGECGFRSQEWVDRAVTLYAADAARKISSTVAENSPLKQPEAARRYVSRVVTGGREWAADVLGRNKPFVCNDVKDAPGIAELDSLVRSKGGSTQ